MPTPSQTRNSPNPHHRAKPTKPFDIAANHNPDPHGGSFRHREPTSIRNDKPMGTA